MNILVTGAGGTLGSRLTPKLKRAFGASAIHCCFHSQHEKLANDANNYYGDLTEEHFLDYTLKKSHPQIIINLVSLTNVDFCEENPKDSQLINTALVERISKLAPQAKLVQISTDYVFDGEKGNYKPGDKPNPISVYGETKLAGETAALGSADNLVVRTSGLFDCRPGNLYSFFADKLKVGEEVSALFDCWYSPTSAESLASGIVALIQYDATGIVHFGGPERVTRFDFALMIADSLGCDPGLVKKKSQGDFKWKARRPKDSSLDSTDGYSKSELKSQNLRDQLVQIISNRE